MRFQDMTYQRISYEEIAADYAALCRALQSVRCEADCLAVLQSQYRLQDKMAPIDLCYVRHSMDVNDPFYAGEQRYYDEIGPKSASWPTGSTGFWWIPLTAPALKSTWALLPFP